MCLRVLFELTPFTVIVEQVPPFGWVDFGAAVDKFDGRWNLLANYNPEVRVCLSQRSSK